MLRFLGTMLVPFGRAPRWQFWLMLIISSALFVPIIGIPLQIAQIEVPEFIGSIGNIVPGGIIGAGAMAAAGLYLMLVAFATRLHDRGRTGFWVFVMLLPIAGIVGLFWLQANLQVIPASIAPMVLDVFNLYYDLANKILAGLAGLLFAWLVIACMFFPGTHGRNWFGRDPSGDEVTETAA